MRVTQKGQVTIPLNVRRALGIEAGTEVHFELDGAGAGAGARIVLDRAHSAAEIDAMRGAGDIALSTEEILALTRS